MEDFESLGVVNPGVRAATVLQKQDWRWRYKLSETFFLPLRRSGAFTEEAWPCFPVTAHGTASSGAGGAGQPGGPSPSQSPQDRNPFQATRQHSLPARSQKRFLDVLRELWPSSCDTTSWNYKEILCGHPAPANSLWMAGLPLALSFLDSPLTPVHSLQDNLGS